MHDNEAPKFNVVLSSLIGLLGVLFCLFSDLTLEQKAICLLSTLLIILTYYGMAMFFFCASMKRRYTELDASAKLKYSELNTRHNALSKQYQSQANQLEKYKITWFHFGTTLSALIARKDAGRVDALHRGYSNLSNQLFDNDCGGLGYDEFQQDV